MFRIRDFIFLQFDRKQQDRGIKYLHNIRNFQYSWNKLTYWTIIMTVNDLEACILQLDQR